MKIGIRNSAEFHGLLEALISELIDAREHFTVHQGLYGALTGEYTHEFYQAAAFWSLTVTAHMDATLLRLCKAYDLYKGNPPSLGLRNWLETIEANLHLFNELNFRERLKGNPFVDSLAQYPRTPDSAQLREDLKSVSRANPLVKKLTTWRNNYLAHRSTTSALDLRSFMEQNPLSFAEINMLITNGIRIVDHYSNLFIATIHASLPMDDYKHLLDAVRRDLQIREARIEAEMAAAKRAMAP